ncbi:MAG: YeiH family protein [Treponema sp.]|nr:YeiH family protein [Treponema sp.]
MKNILGILLCLAVSIPAWLLGAALPLVGGPIVAILAGMFISLAAPGLVKMRLVKHWEFSPGLKFTSKKILQYSIIFLGFEMNLSNLLAAGRASLLVMCATFALVFVAAFFLGRALRLSSNTTTLIGVGTAICGGSAIAAVAPVIRAEDEDVTKAISTIFLFNIIAVFIFPGLGRAMGMDDSAFGIWAGTAINDTSSVVAAGTAWSVETGNNIALNYATIVKLTRTLFIVPIALFLAARMTRKQKKDGAETGSFSLAKVFPWFILIFVGAVLAQTFFNIPANITAILVTLGKFGIVMAMSAIGLNTNLKALFSSGIKPIALGCACWLTISLGALAALRFLA